MSTNAKVKSAELSSRFVRSSASVTVGRSVLTVESTQQKESYQPRQDSSSKEADSTLQTTEVSKPFRPARGGFKYWKTKEGRSILIEDMTDSHLMNTIAMLIRNNKLASLYFSTLISEAVIRGLWTDTEKLKWKLLGVSPELWKLINI